jgi:hypothetical protein
MGMQLTIDKVILAFPRSDLQWEVLVTQCFFRKTSANVLLYAAGNPTFLCRIAVVRRFVFHVMKKRQGPAGHVSFAQLAGAGRSPQQPGNA